MRSDNTWAARMTPRKPREPREPREPMTQLTRVAFRAVGASGRPMRCAVYRVETGHELRFEYEDRPDDLLRSQLFPVADDAAINALAGEWQAALETKGFTVVNAESMAGDAR